MDQARTFYEALGLTLDFISRKPRRGPSPVWAELSGSGGGLALHYVPEGLLLQINENDHELQRSSSAYPAVQVTELTRDFGSTRALDGASFEVGQGEIFGLLGPNGAGNPVTGLWHSFWRGAANSSREAEWTAESRYASCALSL